MSINPGVSEIVTNPQPVGDAPAPGTAGPLTQSQTLNPPSPIEYGRTVSGGIEGNATEGSELPA